MKNTTYLILFHKNNALVNCKLIQFNSLESLHREMLLPPQKTKLDAVFLALDCLQPSIKAGIKVVDATNLSDTEVSYISTDVMCVVSAYQLIAPIAVGLNRWLTVHADFLPSVTPIYALASRSQVDGDVWTIHENSLCKNLDAAEDLCHDTESSIVEITHYGVRRITDKRKN